MTGETLQPGQADLPSAKSTASYWHREPSKTLLGHRTTRDLPPTADVVVIGSGITGAFATKELLERADARAGGEGKRVVLLEAREVCWGATGRVSSFDFLCDLRTSRYGGRFLRPLEGFRGV